MCRLWVDRAIKDVICAVKTGSWYFSLFHQLFDVMKPFEQDPQ